VRIENVARLLRALTQRLVESDPSRLQAVRVLAEMAQNARLSDETAAPKAKKRNRGSARLIAAVGDPRAANGIPANTARLLHCATQLRERMSADQWRTVQRLARLHEPVPQTLEAALTILDAVLPAATALAGYAFDDMTRDDSWQFLVIGRQLERAAFIASMTHQALSLPNDDCDAVLDALLEIGNVAITYRARYQRHPELLPALDLLLLDQSNPHALSFQLAALARSLSRLRERLGFASMNDPQHLLPALQAFDLACLEDDRPGALLPSLLTDCERSVAALSDELTQRFFIHAGESLQTSVAA
jgi:uncharacterized alpha-E superfamily protein